MARKLQGSSTLAQAKSLVAKSRQLLSESRKIRHYSANIKAQASSTRAEVRGVIRSIPQFPSGPVPTSVPFPAPRKKLCARKNSRPLLIRAVSAQRETPHALVLASVPPFFNSFPLPVQLELGL